MRFGPQDFRAPVELLYLPLGKLKRGVSLAQARADLRLVTGRLAQAYPGDLAHTGATLYLFAMRCRRSRLMLKVLLGAALCVLLISCTNLANLLLARSMTRRRELAVRAAIGAGRETGTPNADRESASRSGGRHSGLRSRVPLCRCWRGWFRSRCRSRKSPPSIFAYLFLRCSPPARRASPLAWFPPCASPAVTMPAVYVKAAIRRGRPSRAPPLRTGDRGSGRVIVLLVSCGLLIRALWRIRAIDPGFHSDHILTLRTALPAPRYGGPHGGNFSIAACSIRRGESGRYRRRVHQFSADEDARRTHRRRDPGPARNRFPIASRQVCAS